MERFEKKEFYTVVIGGWILSNIAGFLNAVALSGLYTTPVSHVTGSITRISLSLIHRDFSWASVYASLVFSFMLGAMVSGSMIGTSKFQLGRRYGIALLLQSGALTLGCILMNFELVLGEIVLSFTCGFQNAMASSYSGAVLRTTHMTGITTDIGIILGQLIAKTPQVDVWKLKVFVPLFIGYFTGSTLGGVFFDLIGSRSLMIPAAALFFSALFYLTWEPAREAREALQITMKRIQNEVELGVKRMTVPITDFAKTGATIIPKLTHSLSARELSTIRITPIVYPEPQQTRQPIEAEIQDFMQSLNSEKRPSSPIPQEPEVNTQRSIQKDIGSRDGLLNKGSLSLL